MNTSTEKIRIYMVPIWFSQKSSKMLISVIWRYLMLVSHGWHDIQSIGIML